MKSSSLHLLLYVCFLSITACEKEDVEVVYDDTAIGDEAQTAGETWLAETGSRVFHHYVLDRKIIGEGPLEDGFLRFTNPVR